MLHTGIDPSTPHKRVVSFADVARQWAPATVRKVRLYLDKTILPALGKRPVSSIQRGDLLAVISELEQQSLDAG